MIRAWRRLAAVVVVGLGVAAPFHSTPSAETSDHGRAVADWSLIAQNTIVAVGKKFPGEAAVYMGIVHAAIYDAVVAIEGGYRPFAIAPHVPPKASVDAAVAAAAHRVLVGRFHDQQFDLDGVYEVYLSGIPDGEAKTNGIQVGEEVGLGMLQLRANDGLDTIVPYLQRATRSGRL